jgi:hypothetical protein
MNIITPTWFDVPGFRWEDLPVNARIAARWVHAGAKVFPCYHRVVEDSRGNIHEVKTPKTPRGFKDASDNLYGILLWWTANPDDLVGVPDEDWALIVDIDMDLDKEEPVDGWASLVEHGLDELVPTEFMVSTPRGGNHSYCRVPEGFSPNSVKNLRLEDGTVLHGVDRRARGGYFIAWSEEAIPDNISQLPFAPIEFCHVYSGGSQGVEYSKSVEEWLTTVGAGKPNGLMNSAKDKIPAGEFGHEEMRNLQRHIIGLAAEGNPGGAEVLDQLRSEYLRPPYNTLRWEADYNAALGGAIQKFGGLTAPSDRTAHQSHSVAAVAIADEKYEFFPTTDDDVLAVPKDGPRVSVSISAGKDFYSQLSVDFYDAHDGTKALSDKAFKEAVGIISGRVRKLPKVEAQLRVAEVGEETFLDLGDESGRCVRISAEGWTVEEESPVLFRRTNLVAPLPTPEPGSDLKEFFNLINIPERSKALYLGFLVSFYFPNIAHPILAPLGPQGSGKSKASEHTHRILDNSPILGRKLAKNIEEWVVAGGASYLINLDNVSRLSEDMSDALCRAVTGDASAPRTLYTNKNVEIIKFRRVLILNGIDILGIREDLADRLLVLEMQAIKPEQRLTESSMDSAAESMGPGVLGALLDVVVLVKQTLPHVHLDRLPRMADFARLLRALEIIYPGLSALEEYELSIEEAAMNAIQQNPVLTAMTEIITEPWEGTSKEMLDLLNKKKPLLDESRKYWPNTPALMTTILARSGPAFTKIGWTVEDLGSRNKDKTKRWRLTPPQPCTPIVKPGTINNQWEGYKF